MGVWAQAILHTAHTTAAQKNRKQLVTGLRYMTGGADANDRFLRDITASVSSSHDICVMPFYGDLRVL